MDYTRTSTIRQPSTAAHARQDGKPAWLVLADGESPGELEAVAPLRAIRITSDVPLFRELVASARPRIIVCSEPPAAASDLDLLLAERARRTGLRIVHMSAPDAVDQRLGALRAGFDDALPWSMTITELVGRLAWHDAHVRERPPAPSTLRFGDGFELDLTAHELRHHGHVVHLRPKEFGLLAVLAASQGRAWTRAELLGRVWGVTGERSGRTVDVHVRWLRSKIEADPDHPVSLVTVRGVGYRLDGRRR